MDTSTRQGLGCPECKQIIPAQPKASVLPPHLNENGDLCKGAGQICITPKEAYEAWDTD